jgi:hypothetical protein
LYTFTIKTFIYINIPGDILAVADTDFSKKSFDFVILKILIESTVFRDPIGLFLFEVTPILL